MTLHVRTLSDRVFEIVRERIVSGALIERAPIRQDSLAAELGVSKIPLREALARLEQEGLIASQANRGYTVQPMSAGQAEEIYELRIVVEPAAAAYAATRADDTYRAQLLDAFERLDAAMTRDLVEAAACNRAFHAALVRAPGRELTVQLVERLSVLAERYVVAHLRPAGRGDRAHVEHKLLLDAWLAGDGPAVEAMLKGHLIATIEDLRAEFEAASKAA
ncbi:MULTISPECIES: GntR family transcriptional regulator [unclassified Sphingomonas]|uniref:GntR family transcriptional regulator n=1 Tax=unclassified Sphingomonas TaxID=196159 RepID=UPI0006F3436C|nr:MULTISPECIES: GntR family transcriptional regulator [unclassified Sphingomonas]KQN05351.1 GntR family transcriptional regulator [Sphingomonas sp. Leaf25]